MWKVFESFATIKWLSKMIEKKIRIEKNEVEQEKLKIYFPHFDIRLNGISVMSVSCSSRLLFLTIMRIF